MATVLVVLVRQARRQRTWFGSLTLAIGAGLWLALIGGMMWTVAQATAAALPSPPKATDPGNPCQAGQTPRTFNVSLINIPIFLNRFGDVVPEGRMYVLDENIAKVRQEFTQAANPAKAAENDLIEPLVVRAHQGDCVEVRFTNRLNEPAPSFNRNASIFTLPGETLRPPGTVTPNPREFAPALTQPDNDFDPALAPNASMHFDGLAYDVKGSDGTAVGNNPDSTAAPGQTITYRLFAQTEGEFQFKDGADLSSQQTRPVDSAGKVRFIGSHSFGAFGAVVVETPGTTWVDARTGGPLTSGSRAVIKHPTQPDFREHVLFMHDEVEAEPGILTRFCRSESAGEAGGNECVNPSAAQLQQLTEGTLPALGGGDADALVQGDVPVKLEWFAFNYRSEPGFNREEVDCPAATAAGQGFNAEACIGEETSLSSWAYGDPGGGDLVWANYRGEPMQIRLLHPAEFETHTFHWHVNRWPFDPKDEGGLAEVSKPTHVTRTTNILDVQAVSPGAHYGLVAQGGAGSSHRDKQATFGDIIFHCHLYPHFATGMWGLNRTLDKRENGTRVNPDGTPIPPLVPLEDFDYQPTVAGRQDPPNPAATTPGYPLFVPGRFGFKAPKPPLGVSDRQATGAFPPTAAEKAAADAGAQVPGGFFQDPCPTGRPVKTFDIAVIEIEQTYNPELQWKNPQSRVYVLESQRGAVEAGQKPEPFSPLLNVGDCVVYNLTNRLPRQFGGTVFDRAQETNEVGLHQHMVQFDVLSSDGAANGWNYDQGADIGQKITYRNFVHEDTATNSFHDHFFPNVHQDNGLFGGSTIHPAGCTFHHPNTHAAMQVGTIVDVRCTPTTDYLGQATDGEDYRNFSLFVEDHVPMFQPPSSATSNDDQFVTPEGVPIYPAKFPSSTDDQGVMGVNYRLEPFEARRDKDPASLFDSRSQTHGMPFTPYLKAYEGDRIKWRLFQLSQEESHGFTLDGFRWKFEPTDPESNVVQAQHIGMLEYIDVRATVERETQDSYAGMSRYYNYSYTGADDLFLGAWGTVEIRACDTVLGPGMDNYLAYLPDNTLGRCEIPEGLPANYIGHPCPTGAPLKTFAVSAINKDITYNKAGDHDPNGLMYALDADLPALQNGTKQPEPLVIRANAGDCVELTLSNRLDPAKMTPHCHEAIEPGQLGFRQGVTAYPACIDEPPRNEVNVPGFRPFPVSARVSMRPQLVNHHIRSGGTNVWGPVGGFGSTARDGTVGPGQSITYRWVLPSNVTGMATLEDRADTHNHLHHGLYGALVIEPAGSTYLNPANGQPLTSGTSAVIVNPNQPDFRENIVLLNSDLALFRKDTNGNPADDQPVPDNFDLVLGPGREADDAEDQGEFSVNYRNEPWSHRYANDQNITNILSSVTHGDPSTPTFHAYAGDKTVFRVAQVVGDARSTGFTLHGHTWRRSWQDPQSQIAASQGQFNPGVVYDIHLDPAVTGGAGGRGAVAGDYVYRSTVLARHLTGGQWGLFRVHATSQPNVIPLPDRSSPPPAAGGGGGAGQPVDGVAAAWATGSAGRRRLSRRALP